MKLGLNDLIDPRLLLLFEESRAFYANRVPGRGPSSREELRAVRASLEASAPVQSAVFEEVVEAGGGRVSVRIHAPLDEPATGVLLEFHGGGIYMGSAAGSDVFNRHLVDALG